MKVCGFTFIRNAVRYDYPIAEAISSVLPLCDKFIVVVGNSEDNTRNLIERIDPVKIKIIDSVWNENLRAGGAVLAEETNKAIDALPEDYTWAFYIQADEVVHEKYHSSVSMTMKQWEDDKNVEGLLFNYIHFYGSYDLVGNSTKWYRNEVRIIRCDKSIRSYRDAQGFRKNGKVLNVKKTDASIYHYGWVKNPAKQQAKQQYFHSLWHQDKWVKDHIGEHEDFDYSKIDSVEKFSGTHPLVMQDRIAKVDWRINIDPAVKRLSLKSRLKKLVENITGWRPGEYKNYKVLRDENS
jgi:hypothetical protein